MKCESSCCCMSKCWGVMLDWLRSLFSTGINRNRGHLTINCACFNSKITDDDINDNVVPNSKFDNNNDNIISYEIKRRWSIS